METDPEVVAKQAERLDDEPAIEAHPCPCLEGNACPVYEDRPKVCRGYPYVGGDVPLRMIGIIERAETLWFPKTPYCLWRNELRLLSNMADEATLSDF